MKWLSILSLVKEILEARFLNSSSVFAILESSVTDQGFKGREDRPHKGGGGGRTGSDSGLLILKTLFRMRLGSVQI